MIAAFIAAAAMLPAAGYDQPAFLMGWSAQIIMLLRLCLLGLSYGLVAVAAQRRSGDALATLAAILCAAAVGWAGWELNGASVGWPAFAALVCLLETRGRFRVPVAALLIAIWALVDASAAFGVVLLLARIVTMRDVPPRQRILLALAALLAIGLLVARGFDSWRALLAPARSWVWADGQPTNKLGDPIGFALFGGCLAFLAIWLLRPSKPAGSDLLAIALFVYLAWDARRNGLWLGLAAAPTMAACLAGCATPWRRAIPAAAALVGAGLLVLAIQVGQPQIGGQPLPPAAIATMPEGGLIAYRPAFEPALRRIYTPEQLMLAAPPVGGEPARQALNAWLRIEQNCLPVAELEKLGASAVVLDSRRDVPTIAAVTRSPDWQIAAASPDVTVLVRRSALQ